MAERSRAVADLYLLDVRLPDGNGIDLLRLVRQWDERSPAVMISGHGTVADAVEATRIGAFDFLEKPLARDRVLLVVKNALGVVGPAAREPALPGAGRRGAEDDRIGAGVPARREQATQVARSDVTRAAVGRVRHRQGAAGRAHPP